MNNTIAWQPQDATTTQLYHFMRYIERKYEISLPDYATLHQWSIHHLAAFWESLVAFFKLTFDTPADATLSYSSISLGAVNNESNMPTASMDPANKPRDVNFTRQSQQTLKMFDAKWFEGATFNFAAKLLQRQDAHPALICIHESGLKETISFTELRQRVANTAAAMKTLGIQPGDRVAGVLGNNAYPVIAMLATASIGAVWSSCSPDFGAEAIVDRLTQIAPKLLFIVEEYTYQNKPYLMHDKINALKKNLSSLQKIVLCTTKDTTLNDCVTWSNFLIPESTATFEPFAFNHPLYILFSSGTTGTPKCIVHGCGGTLLQHLKELGLHTDLTAQDTLLFYTTCGWMMWNWMVSALALGTTLVLYDGAPTHTSMTRLFDVIEAEKVTVFGTSAKYLASLEHEGISLSTSHHLENLRTILSTGSPLLPTQYDYVNTHLAPHIQLSSISGGTDIISCFALGNPISPVYRGELQCIGLGMAVEVYDEAGHPLYEKVGELVCTAPFPSMPLGFYNDAHHEKYQQAYFARFPNVWTHGDFAEITSHHGVIITGRSDATLNPGGVRIGTAEIYRQLERIPEIQDSVVIGQEWQHDTRVVLFVTLTPGAVLDDTLKTKIRQTLRQHASPRHVPAKIIAVPDIPRTINGKTVEIAVRQVVHGQEVAQLSSLANPDALLYFQNREELSVD